MPVPVPVAVAELAAPAGFLTLLVPLAPAAPVGSVGLVGFGERLDSAQCFGFATPAEQRVPAQHAHVPPVHEHVEPKGAHTQDGLNPDSSLAAHPCLAPQWGRIRETVATA